MIGWIRKYRCRTAAARAGILLACLANGTGVAEDLAVTGNDLPRLMPLDPAAALDSFRIKPGFQIELAAAEPLVADPVAMDFDAAGQLYVVEMRGYSERAEDRLGRIRLLQDTDGDGVFDVSRVFLDGLVWPTAVLCYDGGIFVGVTPDILYCKDTDGDGVADASEVLFTGFGNTASRLNVQALINSFRWGLDNRIHGASGLNGGSVRSLKHPDRDAVDLRGRDFSFDPNELLIRPEPGGGQHGMCFDNAGGKWVCSNSRHIQQIIHDPRLMPPNPSHSMPAPRVDVAVDGPAAEVFRISPDEPWRVIRTRWRMSGLVSGPVEGGGRPSGYFTAATGITVYRGDAWPESFLGDAFIADCGSNLVHRKKLLPTGMQRTAKRPDDERDTEFLASTDNWFRPVQMANGPDGNLYILDLYREVIEHPWSLPEQIKKHLDLNAGNDRGRIYRVRPAHSKQIRFPVDLTKLDAEQLVATLAHPNSWHRETAARLIFERQDSDAVSPLRRMVAGSASWFGRLHAMHALDGLDALDQDVLLSRFRDPHPDVRAHTVRWIAERLTASKGPNPFGQLLLQLTSDPDPRVQFQIAVASQWTPTDVQQRIVEALLDRDAVDRWVREAALHSLSHGAERVLLNLASRPAYRRRDGATESLSGLFALVGRQRDPRALADVATFLTRVQLNDSEWIPLALADGTRNSTGGLGNAVPEMIRSQLARRALSSATGQGAVETRARAVELLGQLSSTGSESAVTETIASLIQPSEPESVQAAALRTLASANHQDFPAIAIARWRLLTPTLRSETIDALLRRREWLETVMVQLESGGIRRSSLSAAQMARLRAQVAPSWRGRLDALSAGSGDRGEIVDSMRVALNLKGNAARGRTFFEARCVSCHRSGDLGYAVGPDLASVQSRGAESLLISILDPNRESAPNYTAYLLETNDGEQFTGIISNQTADMVTLTGPNASVQSVPRVRIERLVSLEHSLMPEGLEADMSAQDVADLLAWIQRRP